MKRTLLFLTCFCFFTVFVLADPIDQKRALQIAKEFVPQSSAAKKAPGKGSATPTSNIVYTHKMPKSGRDAFYIVNVGDAFVLVSADDVAHQILGYSFDKGFPVAADGTVQLPPHVKGFFDDLAAQMEAAIEAEPNRAADDDWTGVRKASRRAPSNLPDSVGPLLTTTWDQGQYYNALCPEDANGPDGHVWAGCVATAMAQIINYWGEPVHGRGTHSYESNYGPLEVNFAESNYDFSNMPDALTGESTTEQVNAVAKLMYDCGVAVNMGYTAGESGAFKQEARAGLINYFYFSPDLSFAEKSYFSNEEWNNLLRQNLAANRPVYYSGQGTGGHAFVCDGYKADDYYHFNFGWGGFADGWFQTSAVSPNGSDFNSSQSAIVGIVPDNTGNVILGQMQGNSTFIVDEPLKFYHLMGHNKYEGSNYNNPCNSTVTFIPVDDSKQMIADIMEFEDQNVQIYDGTNTNNFLRSLNGGGDNNLSPVVSSTNAITVTYSGNLYYAGFKLNISQDNGYRMVSNITSSIDATTVHLTWIENGGASQWQVEYSFKGFELGKGTVYNATANTATFENLEKFTEYDFYIRSDYGNDQYGPWNKATLMIEAPYWQDVVTSQPEGYVFNEVNNTVEISTAEGLAWWTRNGCIYDAYLIADIDLSDYKWRPTSSWCSLYGQNHVISNAYINERADDVGLFSYYRNGTIADVGLVNFNIVGRGNRTGGLCGTMIGTIRNCYITNSVIDGADFTGGLIGAIDKDDVNSMVLNCYVNVYTLGSRWAGLMIGVSNKGIIKNCYAAGSFRQRAYCYNGGIVAYSSSGSITNCYSTEMPMGVVGYVGNTIITDTATFDKTGTNCFLRSPVMFDDIPVTDMISALNFCVEQVNDKKLCVWKPDANNKNDGYPIFGNKHVVQCPNVSDVTIQNDIIGNENVVSLAWKENGEATQWRIRYRRHDNPNASYTYITSTENPTIIRGIPLGYIYNFNVRAIKDSEVKSGWSETQDFIVDLPYWTDIIKEQPEGYIEDSSGNVTISSPEGLAWLSVLVNGIHGIERQNFSGKTILLNNNISLHGFRWYPIGRNWETPFCGSFQGNNFKISNLYVNSSGTCLGLFGYAGNDAVFSNVSITDGTVNCIFCDVDGGGYGGLLGTGYKIKEINNCSSNVSVSGIMQVGSLVGYASDDEGESAIILNCFSTGNVFGRESTAGLIGEARGIVIQNCYSTSNVYLKEGNWNPWYRGGLVGNLMSNASIRNCYSTGIVEIDDNSSWFGRVVGCPYKNSTTHFVYSPRNDDMPLTGASTDEIADSASFVNLNGQLDLLTPITINGSTYDDLISALNAWVANSNDPMLKNWNADTNSTNGGYPVFGDNYEPSCYNPTNVSVSNATIVGETIIRTKVTWEQEGNPSSWDVLYVAAQQSLDKGTIIRINSNPCELTNLPVGEVLNIYVRARNNDEDISGWSKPITYIPDKLHWTEVVTSQPEGYSVVNNEDVYIYNSEAFAWLSSVMNRLNGNSQSFYPRRLFLMSDIDLSSYRWTPIAVGDGPINDLVFDGNGHSITGLYCNEYKNKQGLFGWTNECTIKNLKIVGSLIRGLNNNGTIAGVSNWTKLINCTVNGEVYGVMASGGVIGNCADHVEINNVAFVGMADSRKDITLPNCYNGFIGGIAGTTNGLYMENTYVAAEIPASSYSGILAGSGSGVYSNLYALYYPTELDFTYENYGINLSFYSGSGTIWTLNTPQYINGAFRSDLIDALNAWVDVNNSEGLYRHWVADTGNVNGGYPIFAPIYTLTYKVDGEVYKTSSLEVGAAIAAIAEPTKEGYTFGGWSELPETMPNHDIEVTGSFYLYGDVNTDTKVNVVDVVDIARYVVETPSENFRVKLADLNTDLTVNIADAVVLVNHISGDQTFARMENPKNSPYDYESCDLRLSTGEDNGLSLTLTGDMDFTAFQFEVDMPEGIDISAMRINSQRKDGHQLLFNKVADNRYRVAALSMSNAVFKGNDGELLNISLEGTGLLDICIHDIHFVTTNGTDVIFDDVYLNGNTTGIADVHAKENTPIYDLQGRRHSTLQRGTNIVGNRKIIVK